MGTVRPALKQEILRELDNTAFGKSLFDVEIQKNGNLVSVTFIPDPNFRFELSEYKEIVQGRFHYKTFEAPGQWMIEGEEFNHENFQNARSRIHAWASRIEQDYKAAKPEYDDLENLREKIFQELGGENIEGHEQFSQEEKQKADERLNDLEEKIGAVLRKRNADQTQINILHDQIRKLKTAIEILDKRTWSLAVANRILNIFKEAKMAVGEVQSLTRDVGNLLPDLSSEERDTTDADPDSGS